MKILHFFDCAGIGALLSHELDNFGVQSKVIQLSPFDPFGFGGYYHNTTYYNHSNELIYYAQKVMRDQDWIILHDAPEYLDLFTDTQANCAVYYHGSRLRHSFSDFRKIDETAEKIFLSTNDLLEYRPNGIVIPQPIDTQLFRDVTPQKNQAMLMIQRRRDREEIEKYARSRFPNILYRERDNNIIYYGDMPKLLSQFGSYLDIKFTYDQPIRVIPNMSLTGLQALSCGLTVYDHKFDPHVGLPSENDSQTTALRFLSELEK